MHPLILRKSDFVRPDLLGAAYEYLIKMFADSAGKKGGEFYTPGEPNSGWIHCSYIEGTPRASYLHAFKSEGKTKYKPVLGGAKNLI